MKIISNWALPDKDEHFISHAKKGKYQDTVLNEALKLLPEDRRELFIDVGAHVGFFSVAAKKAGFRRVKAFEPYPDNFECLLHNAAPLGVECMEFGLSDEDYYLVPSIDKENNSGAISFSEGWSEEEIKVCIFNRLDDVVPTREENAGKCLIKMDVQGMEVDVLKGALATIGDMKPIIIVETVCNGKTNEDIAKFMKDYDYELHKQCGKDAIYVPR